MGQDPSGIPQIPSPIDSDSQRVDPAAFHGPVSDRSPIDSVENIPEIVRLAANSEEDEFSSREQLDFEPQQRLNFEHAQLIRRLDRQITELTTEKTDVTARYIGYEQELAFLRPRVAELEQAEAAAKATTNLTAIAWVIGGAMVSYAGTLADSTFKLILSVSGATIVIGATISMIVLNRYVWAKQRSSPAHEK